MKGKGAMAHNEKTFKITPFPIMFPCQLTAGGFYQTTWKVTGESRMKDAG